MLRIGLTGGIGSGKSTVSKMFAELGVTIIDADRIAHSLTAADSEISQTIIEHFGQEFAQVGTNTIDRKKLRSLVFNDDAARSWLNSVLHPAIRQQMLSQLQHHQTEAYVILSIPLLIENNMQDFVDRILVIDIPEQLQLERASLRDGAKNSDIKTIISKQATRQLRIESADDIIENSGDIENLQQSVLNLHKKYIKNCTY